MWHSFLLQQSWQRQNISRLALEGFQDSLALTSSTRNRGRHSGNYILVERPLLYYLGSAACLFLSTALSSTCTHLLAIAEEVSTCLLNHSQKWLASNQQLAEEILRPILHGRSCSVIVAAPLVIKPPPGFQGLTCLTCTTLIYTSGTSRPMIHSQHLPSKYLLGGW